VECDRGAPADAESVDHRDDGLCGLGQGCERAAGQRRVFCRALRVAGFLELRDIGTRNEGDVARAAQHDDPHLALLIALRRSIWSKINQPIAPSRSSRMCPPI